MVKYRPALLGAALFVLLLVIVLVWTAWSPPPEEPLDLSACLQAGDLERSPHQEGSPRSAEGAALTGEEVWAPGDRVALTLTCSGSRWQGWNYACSLADGAFQETGLEVLLADGWYCVPPFGDWAMPEYFPLEPGTAAAPSTDGYAALCPGRYRLSVVVCGEEGRKDMERLSFEFEVVEAEV